MGSLLGGAYNHWELVLAGPWGMGATALAAAACAAAIALSARGLAELRGARRRRRALLVGLRSSALACALVLFLQPAIRLSRVDRAANHVAVLVDDSRSMALAERPGEPTRAQRAAALVARARPDLAAWRRDHRVDLFTFSSVLAPATEEALARGSPARGDATLLREGLAALRARFDGQDLAGVVVISDGIDTGALGEGALDGEQREFLAGLGAPVHTAWVGRPGLRDVAVERVLADDFAFVRNAVKVEAVIRASGVDAGELEVALRREGELVKVRRVALTAGRSEQRVALELIPDRVGRYVFEVSVAPVAGEANLENNSRAFVLKVLRDKIRVLQVAGRPSWDERYLRALLKRNPNVDLISFFILRTPTDIQLVPQDELSLIPFPTRELFVDELPSFDVVVLQNFEYGPYQMGGYLTELRRFVEERGGGLAMIGGDLSFSSGAYALTPLAEVLPVELYDAQLPPERLLSEQEFRPDLTAEGLVHPVTALRREPHENVARWAALPPLAGANLVPGARPGATVLATHPQLRGRDGRPMPVVAVAEVGEGRSLAVGTDSTWHWGFLAAGAGGDDGRAFQRFWENALRWLSKDPELQLIHLETEKLEYLPGAAVRADVRVRDRDYQPARAAAVSIDLVRAGGPAGAVAAPLERRAAATDGEGELHVELHPPGPGSYRAIARATIGGRETRDEQVFVVAPEGRELAAPEARDDLLRAVAAATGGQFLDDPRGLGGLELLPPRLVPVGRKRDVELWSGPWLLAAAVGLLGLEWTLRRRAGFA